MKKPQNDTSVPGNWLQPVDKLKTPGELCGAGSESVLSLPESSDAPQTCGDAYSLPSLGSSDVAKPWRLPRQDKLLNSESFVETCRDQKNQGTCRSILNIPREGKVRFAHKFPNLPKVRPVTWIGRSPRQPTNEFEENKAAWNLVTWMGRLRLVSRDLADKTECPPSVGAVPFAR